MNGMFILYDAMNFQIILKDVFHLRVLVFFMNQNIVGRVVDFIQYKKRSGTETLNLKICQSHFVL